MVNLGGRAFAFRDRHPAAGAEVDCGPGDISDYHSNEAAVAELKVHRFTDTHVG
jgi:hypothetical protein